MIICIDYDGTFTAIPELLTSFITAAQAAGHRVICVTLRYKREVEPVVDSIGKLCEVFYTSRQAKIPFLAELGILPDIWIDDDPVHLFVRAKP